MQAIDELNMLLGIGPPKVKLPLTLERSGYQPVRQIGKGGFGQAHLVFHKVRQQYFVAKHVNLAGMTQRQRKEAHNEITMLQRLDHPNIVRYVEYVEEGPHLYIVMEYADGGDLFSHLKKIHSTGKSLTEEQIMALFTQTAMAIKHMHDRRMLHRDIKAQNVFLTKSHVVKLGDFGISTVLNSTMAMAQTMCGTPCYFSPELCAGKPYNNKSDIWALGVLLYEMCTCGDLPFEAANVKTLMDAITKKTPKRVPSQYSDGLANLVAAMLNKDPKMRPDINGVLKSPAVVKACPGLVEKLAQLANPAALSPQAGHGSKSSDGPASPPTRKDTVSPPAPPPRGVAKHIHDDARDVLLAEPPANPPPLRYLPPAEPNANKQPPKVPAADGVAPHRHFDDTHNGAAYKPALLQQAVQRAGEADDDNPNCDPAYQQRNPMDDLSQVVQNLATMRDERLKDDMEDEVGPAVQGSSSRSPKGVSVMTNDVPEEISQSVEFEDPMGARVDLNEAAKIAGSPMFKKQPSQFAQSHPQRDDRQPNVQRLSTGAKLAGGAGLQLTAKQKAVLRDFAAKNNVNPGAAAAAIPEQHDDDDEDDTCIGGHCLCGETVYAAWLSTAVGTFRCDCMACRRFSGNVQGTEWIHFPEVAFTDILQQSPAAKTFIISPNAIEMYFCSTCGSSIGMLHEGIEGCVIARATLSDSSAQVFAEATKSA